MRTEFIALGLLGCASPSPPDPPVGPMVSDFRNVLSPLFDRHALLRDAVDFDQAVAGSPPSVDTLARLDPARPALLDLTPPAGGNLDRALDALAEGYEATASTVAPYRAVLDDLTANELAPLRQNLWRGEATTRFTGEPRDVELKVAWVEVGWISEVRLIDDDSRVMLGFSTSEGRGWWTLANDEVVWHEAQEFSTFGLFGPPFIVSTFADGRTEGTVGWGEWIEHDPTVGGRHASSDGPSCWDETLQDRPCK